MSDSATFRSLRHRNAKVFFGGLLASNVGTWMQMTATAWLIREQTDSGTALGLVVACQFLPMLLLVPYTGALADRRDRLSLTLVCQYGLAVQAVAMTALDAFDLATVPVVAVLSLMLGVINAIENPARRGLVGELVEPAEIPNAMALNTSVMTGSRVFGPALAGMIVAAAGTVWCFGLNAASFVAIIWSLKAIDRAELSPVPPARRGGRPVREGLAYAVRQPTIRLVLLVLTVVGTFTFNYQVAMPVLVDEAFGAGSAAFGWLLAISSVGSVIGSLLIARTGRASLPAMLIGTAVLGASSLAVGFAPNLAVSFLAAIPLGIGGSAFMASSTGLLNVHAPAEYRSRMLSLQTMAFLGSTPIGSPITGWVGDTFGARWSLGYGGVVALVMVVGAVMVATALDRASEPASAGVTKG